MPPESIQPPSPMDNFMFAAGFKSISDAPIAMSLTNAVLLNASRPQLNVVDELSCERVLLGEGRKYRGCRLDLSIMEGDHLLNLEVQITALRHMAERMVFNMSRMLSLGTVSGAKYEELPRITVIAILDFEYRDGHTDFHQPFGLYYEKDPQLVTSKFDYHIIEMPKFRKIKPDIKIPLHRWLYYLSDGYKDPDDALIKEALKMDEGLYQFAMHYQRNLSDPKIMHAYYGHLMERMDELERIDTAMYMGEAKNAYESLRFMSQNGMPVSVLRQYAQKHGITPEKLNQIIQS